jgi:hypothetical protein
MVLNGGIWRCHRPHPGKEAKKYQVEEEEARYFLECAGVTPETIAREERAGGAK